MRLENMNEKPILRNETTADRATVRVVHERAFARKDEADLVQQLHQEGVILASWVAEIGGIAEIGGQIVASIVFSRIFVKSGENSFPAVALAPLAVLPQHQRKGIGAMLVVHGLDRLQRAGESIVLVLGDPGYYSRFGFSAEKAEAIVSPFPPAHFMALDLHPGALQGVRGRVHYPAAFQID